MSSPPPTKPPRGVKQGKETSGLLMSVIRTLSASETNEQREKERAKLEKEYKKSDARLDELVAAHADEIMEVMQKFSRVSAALGVWGQRTDAAVARLGACRGLLQLRRDDLKRLWLDARTQHYALQMLTDISRVAQAERSVREAVEARRWLAAATTLQGALAATDTTLASVSALQHTRDHLENKKKELVNQIVKELNNAVYRGDPSPMSRRPSARRRTALLLAELTKSEDVTDSYLQDVTPEFEASLMEEDRTFETTVMISLEALGVLEQFKEATEKFKVQIQDELLDVIDTVSRRIIEEGDTGDDVEGDAEGEQDSDMQQVGGATETGRPLARLVACLKEEFRACAARNKRLLQLWRAALQKHGLSDSCLHSDHHYWSAVQQLLQLLLTEYLQIESVTLAASRAAAAASAPTEVRLADYFAKKRPQMPRARLYRLPAPVTSVTSTARPHRHPLVCAPAPTHLYAVLPSLHALCAEIEPNTGGECSLRAFLSNYVRTGEAERLAAEARRCIDTAMAQPAAWRERGPPAASIASRCEQQTVFSCCATSWAGVWTCGLAARRCGACGGATAAMAALQALAALATHSRAAAARMQPGYARAHRWLEDDDIVRFLQALPNWAAVTSSEPIIEDKQHEEELKQAYEREAEILGSSLGDGAVARTEIVSDISVLTDIALMCETMNWLTANIRALPSVMSGSVKLSEKLLNDIASVALIFEEIEHKCLLFLHLEVRIECFQYLGEECGAEDEAGGTGGAGGAGRLASALLALHEHIAPIMAPHRLAYIMCGVGEMMSAGVVRGGASGASCGGALTALRHCLAALRLEPRGLHAADRYLQLLQQPPTEIIAMIKEKGPQFSELEYLNAFKIIGTKRGITDSEMKRCFKDLSSALGHIGVTV